MPANWGENKEYLIQEKIQNWIYPYEWSFEMLKSAALQTLKLQELALEYGYNLKDASAYNIIFINLKPVHIDLFSWIKEPPNIAWVGLEQFFCEFINPLLVQRITGLGFQAFFKSGLNGLPSSELYSLMSLYQKLKPQNFTLVTCKVLLDNFSKKSNFQESGNKNLPDSLLIKLQLSNIKKLKTKIKKIRIFKHSSWSNYRITRQYSQKDLSNKHLAVDTFINQYQTDNLIDYGSNDGEFTLKAARSIDNILAVDLDATCIDIIFQKFKKLTEFKELSLAVIDLSNPSPAIGWENCERQSFLSRTSNYQAFFALALVHHLRITANIPTKMIFNFLAKRHSIGMLEYVAVNDPVMKNMLRRRPDLDLSDYSWDAFCDICKIFFKIQSISKISDTRSILILKRIEHDQST